MDTQPGSRDPDPGGQQGAGDFGRTQRGWRLPTEPAGPSDDPTTRETLLRDPGTAQTQMRDPGTAQTQMRDPGTAQTQMRDPGTAQTQMRAADAGVTRPGRGAGSGHPAEGAVRRFGPGVSAPAGWTGPAGPDRPAKRRFEMGGVLLLVLFLGAVVAYLLLQNRNPLVLTGAEVAPAAPPGQACNATVDVVGTIHTNGQAGSIQYRWLRSDGESTAALTQTVDAGQPVVQVHMMWTLSGKGSYSAAATLEIEQPQPVRAVGGFVYSCR